MQWELRDPWFLVLLLLVPLVYWLGTRWRSLLSFSSVQHLPAATKTWRTRLARLPALLMALAAALLVLALARPRTPQSETRVSRDGIAIMMVVDLSSSMNARDLVKEDTSVNRLAVVKEVFLRFVLGGQQMQGRTDDLIGLVTFAGYADSVCPLTLDHGNLANIVRDLQIVDRESEDGTAMGDGLGLAVERLRRSKAKSKIAVLLTDGVTTAGVIDPNKAAELAAQQDIKVYCIGAGTNGVAPVPSVNFFGQPTLVGHRVEIDEDTLKSIAKKTGGQYFRAEDQDALEQIYQKIDQLERVEVSEVRYLQYTEHFAGIVLGAMGSLAAALLLAGTVFRTLP